MDINLNLCPDIPSTLHIQIHHSASTVIMHQVIFRGLEACIMSTFGLHQIGEKKGYLDTIVYLLNVIQKRRDFNH